MSTTGAQRRATYEDVLAAPPHKVAEIIDGELHVSPRPGGPHTAAASALGALIEPPFKWGRGGPGGWIILDEPELHLGEEILVPDLGGWRRSTMERVPNAAFFEIRPDWVCEVLSPAGERIDRAKKLPIFARNNVDYAWLVNPIQRTLEVMRREGDRWLTLAVHQGDEMIRAEPFDEVELELGLLWADVDLEPPTESR